MKGIEDEDPLGLYFSTYLHQDWMYEFDSPGSAFEAMLTFPSREGLQRLIEQLNALLELDDEQLDAKMRHSSPDLDVGRDYGWNEREWLRSLRDRTAAELSARTASRG